MSGAVGEAALIEEMSYLISHIAHSEQHIIEALSASEKLSDDVKKELVTILDTLRLSRQILGTILLKELKAGIEFRGGEWRTAFESFWCVLKHLLMAIVHTDECIEKYARRASEGEESAFEKVTTLLEIRRTLKEALKKVIDCCRKAGVEEVEECVRCLEDIEVDLDKAKEALSKVSEGTTSNQPS